MPLTGEYEPSPWDWVREQVEEYEASNGERANTLRDTGLPIVIVTTRGNKSGKLRKFGLMRVEHEGEYALVASIGGAPKNPSWYHHLLADPTALMIQDGPEPHDFVAREVAGRGARPVVGARRRGIPHLRRVPGEDRADDPGLRGVPADS